MNTTTTLAKLAALTAAVSAPAMLFLGAGSATAQEAPVCQNCSRISSTVGSVPSVSHPDFDWHPIAPAARPGSPRTAPAATRMPKNRTGTAGFEPETF
jgi:hypothetical protein